MRKLVIMKFQNKLRTAPLPKFAILNTLSFMQPIDHERAINYIIAKIALLYNTFKRRIYGKAGITE